MASLLIIQQKESQGEGGEGGRWEGEGGEVGGGGEGRGEWEEGGTSK